MRIIVDHSEISVKVTFLPIGLPTKYSQRFFIIGDNGGCDPFTLEGESCVPVFEVVSVSGNSIALSDERFQTDYTLCELLFDSLNPGTPQTKTGTNITS
jgi:hypothetical protein